MEKNIVIGRNLLETITSALYENPIILFREYVQNSLDAYNESVKHDGKMEIPNFKVAIDISKEEKKIVISDNGYAIEGEGEFERKMLGFGNSDKEDRAQFIGFRGIGRISALPFCKRLIFINKTKGEKIIKRCVWEGKKYQSILNDGNAKFATFQDVIEEIVEFESEISNYNDDEHFFKVIIEDYTYEISEIIEYPNFEQNLQQLLPLKYSDKFKASEKIIAKYKEFMNEDLSDFMCSVYLNDKELTKNYEDSRNVLESDIIFWEIRGKKGNKDEKGEKIGILWFTFNRRMSTIPKNDNDYGVLVRSKNVLMGDNDTFASLCQNSKDYVSTYSELTQTLRCVYGEMLINSPLLHDNARREWFKTDENSIYLKYVIIDFMRRLLKCRYAASHYFRKSAEDKKETKKQEYKKCLIELIDVNTNNISINDFYKDETKESKKEESKNTSSNSNANNNMQYEFADEDMALQAQSKKKVYDELMGVIKAFFEKEGFYDGFLKLRAFIKKHYS